MSPKKVLLIALTGLWMFAACTKNDTTSSDPKSTWSIDGVTYTSTSPATYSSESLTASDNTLNGNIEIDFSKKPTMSGSYSVSHINFSDTSSISAGSSSCRIIINTPSVSNYRSTGSQMVSVSVGDGGKLTATFSSMQMENGANSSTSSGTIIEK